MLTSSISNTRWFHSVDEPCNFMDSYVFILVLADVIANHFGIWFLFVADVIAIGLATCILYGWCCCHVALLYDRWWCSYQQADVIACLFVLADVIAICFCDCRYCHIFYLSCTTVVVVASLLADVIAKMADGIAIVCVWQMLLPSGWCYCHCVLQFMLADVIAWWLRNAYHGCGWLMLLPMWQMEWPLGQCFNFNSVVLCRTSSHMWGRMRSIHAHIGKFNLPYIWDRILLNIPGLNLKRHAQAVGHANSNTPYHIIPTSPKFK